MRRSILVGLLTMLPLMVSAAGATGLLERVPTLPNTLAKAQSDFAEFQTQAEALRSDLSAAQNKLDAAAETNAAADEKRGQQQASDLQALTGMSAEEMDAAKEDEIAARMLGEFGDWSAKNTDHTMRAIEEYQALTNRWAKDHTRLNAKLDADLAARVKSVAVVDCAEAGKYADAIQTHAIALERAAAHAALAPGHLPQAADYLVTRRAAVKADAIFTDRFAAEAQGVDMMSGQSFAVQSQTLLRIGELLHQTVEITRDLLSWDGEKARLENIRPKSTCG